MAPTVIRQLSAWLADYNRIARRSALGFSFAKGVSDPASHRTMCLENRGLDHGRVEDETLLK